MSVFAEALRDKTAADERAAEQQAAERAIIAERLARFRRVLNPILSIADDARGLRGTGGEAVHLHATGHRWRHRLGEANLGFLGAGRAAERPDDYSHVVVLNLLEQPDDPECPYELECFNSLGLDFSGLSWTRADGQEALRWSWFGPLSSPLWRSVTRLGLRGDTDPVIREIGLRVARRLADLADPATLPMS